MTIQEALRSVPAHGRLSTTSGPRHLVRAAMLGTLAAVLVLVGRLSGVVSGGVALALLAALIVLAPTARELSQRLAVNLCLLAGSVPVLWMLPAAAPVGRVTCALAVVVGVVTFWALRAPGRFRELVPAVRLVDLWPLVAGLVSLAMVLPWLRPASAAGTLSQLQSGWDNASHFNMFSMIREHGITTDRLGAAPGLETWKFSDYPQGFHTLAAAFAELVAPGPVGAVSDEIVLLGRSIGVISGLAVVVLAAALCAMPGLRTSPWRALVAVFGVLALMLFSPLGALPLNGFINFYVACALTGTVVILAASSRRPFAPAQFAALCAALVGVAQGWILLLALALPAAALVLLPLRRHRFRCTLPEKVISGLCLGITILAVARTALLLVDLSPTEVLTTNGATPLPPVGLTLALLLAATATSLLAWGRARSTGDTSPDDTPVLHTWIVPAAAMVSSSGLALVLLSSAPTVTYYFWKYLFAALVVGGVSAIIAIIHLVPPLGARSRSVTAGVSALACVALTQVFGLAVPRLPSHGFVVESPGWAARGELAQKGAAPQSSAMLMTAALTVSEPDPAARPYFILPTGADAQHPLSAAQWYLSLTNRWTQESDSALLPLLALDGTADRQMAVMLEILAAAPRNVVVTDPATAALLRAAAPAADQDRIHTWQ